MENQKILLNTFDKIEEFINITDQLDYKLNLISGNYIVNAKSILGIFCLDLSNPIEISFTNEQHNLNYCPNELESFLV